MNQKPFFWSNFQRLPSTQRINSILTAPCLDQTVTDCLSWKPNALEFDTDPEISIPTNLRLGQQVEKTLIELIKGSRNYSVIHDGVQIKKDGKTIGELDAIIRDEENGQLIHLEIAYKFYLLDPSISSDPIKQWIGPNRNDTLHEKLHKIKRKQFPILKTPEVEEMIGKEITSNCTQALCLMAYLYIPRDSDITMPNNVSHAVVGHYLTFQILVQLDHTSRLYRIPKKTDWGIDPATCVHWFRFDEIQPSLAKSMDEKRSMLVWEKAGNEYSTFFVVWW